MPTKRMLIDSTHAEETRVVVVTGNRLEDFDVEVESRRHLKGNIYLAKITRVEPSLQAAFVDFGGNRHGFLAFNEIHPDYYQIPVADREALIAEEREAEQDSDDQENGDNGESEVETDENGEPVEGIKDIENIGGDDVEDVETRRPRRFRRNYKIQEVIKRNQILLIQVVKEERGNKGAALTSYISLPGRYCVLMPNTARGGGISRKISNTADRRRLKTILSDLEIPEGVAVIVRTAGSKRTKAEIKRDYDYLMRLWNQVRDKTLESIAPCAVYEEGNLIKRAIRDLYTKDIEEIIIEGNEGYRTAKDFMKLLIPSHAKRVQLYKDTSIPLFHRHQIEGQLDAMHDPVVSLKSGGYIVIGQTEALVAIDVNSGKATRERNIEETALQTNLEAADEIARQLRLRDMAGLVVIDFIDMEVHRNQNKVERQIKEAMRVDRARIQMSRISHFGLLEMSRQRLRPSLMETSTEPCPHCSGTGAMRSTESAALSVIRAIEEEGMRGRATAITVHVSTPVALYILNHKRSALQLIKERFELDVILASDESMIAPNYRIERTVLKQGVSEKEDDRKTEDVSADDSEQPRKKRRRRSRKRRRGMTPEGEENIQTQPSEPSDVSESDEEGETSSPSDETTETEGGEEHPRKRRRGRRGGRRRSRNRDMDVQSDDSTVGDDQSETVSEPVAEVAANDDEAAASATDTTASEEPRERKPRQRTRRRKPRTDVAAEASAETASPEPASEPQAENAVVAESDVQPEDKPKPKRKPRAKAKSVDTAVDKTAEEPQADSSKTVESEAPAAPEPVTETTPEKAPEKSDAEIAAAAKTTTVVVGTDDDAKETATESKPSRKGWWRRSS